MRLGGMRQSGNIIDMRGSRGRLAIGGGLGTIVLVILGFIFGVDPSGLLDDSGAKIDQTTPGEQQPDADPLERERRERVAIILASTEDVWSDLFADMGKRYTAPELVLFRDEVQSTCGYAGAAVGPFYCPADDRVYIDLSFFSELDRRFKAPGDFAQAYVVAHEIGHHVQNLLGISDRVRALQADASKSERNALSVRLELQADFLAGVWAKHANKRNRILETGDVEEGLRAAASIGDDRLQKQSQGHVVPDAFTHGTSAQRVKWFRKGLESGDISQGDTFAVSEP